MMAEQVLVLHQAAVDIEHGRDFYEKQRPKLGDYFADSLVADIESLRLSAGIHSVHFGAHRMLAKHFPFAIYYNLHDGAATVIAVLDIRRNPTWMHDQMSSRRRSLKPRLSAPPTRKPTSTPSSPPPGRR